MLDPSKEFLEHKMPYDYEHRGAEEGGKSYYLAPPIFAVFFLGVFVKRMNGQGALWGMLSGFALGLFRMAVDTPVSLGLAGFEGGYPKGTLLWIVNNTYFQYFSVLITFVPAVVMIGVSYATSVPEYTRLQGLTFATTTAEERKRTRESWG